MHKKPAVLFAFLFLAVSLTFMALPDTRFLVFLPFLILLYFTEGKLENHFFIKLVEAFPLMLFILLIISGINLFYILSLLLLMLISAKFILKKEKKDYYEIFVIGCLMVLLSSVSTISISFAILLFLFLYIGSIMLMLSPLTKKQVTLTTKFFKGVLFFTLISFLLSFALFFSFPRLSLGYFHGVNIGPEKKSGFSENIVIQKGKVNLDNVIVMRIESDKNYSPLYITGVHYSAFNGESWKKEAGKIKIFPYNASNNFGMTSGMKKFTVYLEPMETTVLFGPDRFTGVHGEFLYLRRNKFGDFFTDMIYYKTIKYDAFSSITGVSHVELIEKVKKDELKSYLQLPNLPEKFKKISTDAASGKSEIEKVEAIKSFLQRNYNYSLNPSAASITDFVLNKKSGYCEHFATAFVLMLRENGIPARLVSGFVTNEYNSEGKYFIVRGRNAHTWAEVYFPSKGWIRFDPTPRLTEKVPSKLSLIIDSIKMSWYRNVVTYNSAKQMEILHGLQRITTTIGTGTNTSFLIVRDLLKEWKYFAILFTVTLLLYILMKKEKIDKSRIGGLITKALGNDRYPYETLVEYAKRKGKLKELESIINEYYKLRFSNNTMRKNEIVQLLHSIKTKI